MNGGVKFTLFLQRLARRKSFRDKLKKLRKKWSISLVGFSPRSTKSALNLPKQTTDANLLKWWEGRSELYSIPPSEWREGLHPTTERGGSFRDLEIEYGKLLSHYGLLLESCYPEAMVILFYDDLEVLYNQLTTMEPCIAIDSKSEAENIILYGNWMNECYPIAIHIAPTTTKRELLHFIEKNYSKLILPLQNRHLHKNPELLNKRTSEYSLLMRDFIYQSRDLSASEIRRSLIRLSKETYHPLFSTKIPSEEVIHQIRSEEVNERKK